MTQAFNISEHSYGLASDYSDRLSLRIWRIAFQKQRSCFPYHVPIELEEGLFEPTLMVRINSLENSYANLNSCLPKDIGAKHTHDFFFKQEFILVGSEWIKHNATDEELAEFIAAKMLK